MSAIFISHSHQDNAWAERIRAWLLDEEKQREEEQRYHSLFLDIDEENGIDVGERWRERLFEHLQLCVAVIVISSEAYASSQWCWAELGVAMASGKLMLPVRIDASPLPKLLSETQATAVAVIDLEQGSAAAWRRLQKGLEPLSWQMRQPWPPNKEPNASPFPGLDCFERKHAAVFFGQEVVREKVLAAIRRLTARQSRLLLILGASGCGKSSLLRAGVMPWLAAADRGHWIVLEPFQPEEKPFDALGFALARAHQNLEQPAPTEPARTAAALDQQLRRLRLAAGQQDARIVIAIDQFEELLAREEGRGDGVGEEADAFLTLLAELLAQKNSQVLILATLRSDFYGVLQLHPSSLHRRAGDPIPLGPMDVDGFRQVIEGPARRVGMRLETGLSDLLVRDTPSGDALPLLAFSLRELWDGRADGAGLTLKQYEDFGGLPGAVQRKADEVLSTSGATVEEIKALESAFIDHLVRLTSDGQAAKQPARLEALPAASRRLVEMFVEARLLVSGKGTDHDAVEIAHEALLRTWPTLVTWIDKGREALLQRLRVRRLGEDLSAGAPKRQRRQALEQLAPLAASGGDEARAVERDGAQPLADLLAAVDAPEADRQDAALVLALIGAEKPLRDCLGDTEAPVAVRRRAAESLGLLAKRSGDRAQRDCIAAELEWWLRSDALYILVTGKEEWAQHDARLPILQGAARGLQLAASRELPLLGSGAGRVVPMLTLTALNQAEGGALEVRTAVLEKVQVWRLPLPQGQQLEMVLVPGGEYKIGSPEGEAGKLECYSWTPESKELDKEPLRPVRLAPLAMARFPITQAQWAAVAELEPGLKTAPGSYEAKGLWEAHGQPGCLPVDSVSWNDCQKWLAQLNRWLADHWREQGLVGEAPQMRLPGEGEWEAACRAESETPFHFGDTLDPSWANYDHIYGYGAGRKNETYPQRPLAIGCFGLVNRWGLAEMHGQMHEWCGDLWHPSPLGGPQDGSPWEDPDPSPEAAPRADNRLLRGGSWVNFPHNCRAAYRLSNQPAFVYASRGVCPCCLLTTGTLLGS